MRKVLIVVVMLAVMISTAGCSKAIHGAAMDAHGYTGWLVEVTAEPMQRAETRDIVREQKLLNHRISNAGWLKRLQGEKIE